MVKRNWFNTLNEALESEGLIDAWEINFGGISYGQTFRWNWDDGTEYGRLISITRELNGKYERPVHYQC